VTAEHITSIDVIEEADKCLDKIATSVENNLQQIRLAFTCGQTHVKGELTRFRNDCQRFGYDCQSNIRAAFAEVRGDFGKVGSEKEGCY